MGFLPALDSRRPGAQDEKRPCAHDEHERGGNTMLKAAEEEPLVPLNIIA